MLNSLKNKISRRRVRRDAEKNKKTLEFFYSAVAFPLRLCVLCGQWFLFFFIKVKQSSTYKQNRANIQNLTKQSIHKFLRIKGL
jgi:hypothetical protein